MKLPRILIMAGLAIATIGTAATPASAQTIFYGKPLGYGYQYIYYTSWDHTAVVSVNYKNCNGVETWDGYNGNPDMTISMDYEYTEWAC